jgi:choline kinase
MLDWLFDHFAAMGLEEVVLVTGHLRTVLREHVERASPPFDVRWVHNEDFDRTNNVYSLWLARDALQPPFILAESDLVLEPGLLEPLLAADGMVVARWDAAMSGTVVEVSASGQVQRLILKRDQEPDMDLTRTFKTVNFYSFSPASWDAYAPALDEAVGLGQLQDYYEAVLGDLINAGRVHMRAVDVTGRRWMEIDDHDDLARALAIFA